MYEEVERCGVHGADWLLALACGAIELRTLYVGGAQATMALIIRRSCRRAYTPYDGDGIDDAGWPKDLAETELIVRIGHATAAAVQLRCAAPLFMRGGDRDRARAGYTTRSPSAAAP
eukprot:UC1_evm1s1526